MHSANWWPMAMPVAPSGWMVRGRYWNPDRTASSGRTRTGQGSIRGKEEQAEAPAARMRLGGFGNQEKPVWPWEERHRESGMQQPWANCGANKSARLRKKPSGQEEGEQRGLRKPESFRKTWALTKVPAD